MIEFKLETVPAPGDTAPVVSIIGLGGAGANVLDHIALEGMDGVDLITMNCDARSLNSSMAQQKVQLGKSLTQGLGCGGDPELGQEAAVSSLADIREALTGRRMIFLCVGLGGGTGSGAAPIVARLARETGAFVIVFATLPFSFEGKRRMAQAQAALEEIRQHANALVCFENDKMGELVLPKKGVTEAFEIADRIICQSVRAVTTVATQPGLIRIGMDDLITALKNADSRCLFGFGQAKGEARATEALQAALKSPLLDRGQLLDKARSVLVHICGGTSLTLFEIETLMSELSKHVSDEAQILFGAACDAKLNDALSVTIISSLGKEKAAWLPIAPEKTLAPAPKPAVPVTPIISPHTHAVPILSVQPRQAPPTPHSSILAPGAATMTCAASGVPVLQLHAQLLPLRPAKPVVRPAPLEPPQPELFATAAEPGPVIDEISQQIESPPPVEEPVMERTMEPVAEEVIEPVMEEVAAEEEPAVFVAEEEPVIEEEEVAIEEEIVAEEEEEIIEEPEPELVAEEEIAPEPELEEQFVAEEEVQIEDEPETGPQHPAFDPGREHAPMRPMPVPQAPPKPAARKFDLREILQRQRQTRLGHHRGVSLPGPAAAKPVPPPQRPAVPLKREIERTPHPDRIAPIRPIPATRGTSPFIPTKAGNIPAGVPRGGREQVTFDEQLVPVVKTGRFEKSEPTVEEGEDLDIPTFLRKKR